MKRILILILAMCLLLCMLPSVVAAEDGAALMDTTYPDIYLTFVPIGQDEVNKIHNPETSIIYQVMISQATGTDIVNYIDLAVTYDANLKNPQLSSFAPNVSVTFEQSGDSLKYMHITKLNNNPSYPLTISTTPAELFRVQFDLPSADAIRGYMDGDTPVMGIGSNGAYKVVSFSIPSIPNKTYEITRAGYQFGTTPSIVPYKIGGSDCAVYVDASRLRMTDHISYEHFAIKDNNGAPLAAGSYQPLNTRFKIEIDPGYRLTPNTTTAGGTAPVAYSTPGNDLSTSGIYDITPSGAIYQITTPDLHADATLLVAVEAIPFDLTVDFENANPDDNADDKAEFVPIDGIGGNDSPYTVTVEDPAKFKVNPDPDYAVKKVSYVPTDDPTATPTELTPDGDGVYTIPEDEITKPITVKVDTAFDVAKLDAYTDIVNSVTGGKRFGQYCVYTGSKSLVLFNSEELQCAGLSANINGAALDILQAPYTIDGSNYQLATIIDFTSVLTEVTPEAVNAYLETILMPSDTANAVVDYSKYDVNGNNVFSLSDVSVTYDFTSLDSLLWTPSVELLLRADMVKTSTSAQKLRVDAYDVQEFLNHYAS